jgi:plastocyanin
MKQVTRRLLILAGLLLLGGAFLGACGGGDKGGGGNGAPPPAATSAPTGAAGGGGGSGSLEITIAGLKYSPERPTVRANQTLTVRVQNNDSVPHTLTIQNGPSTGTIGGGASGSVNVSIPGGGGGISFYCEVHGRGQMSGTIVYQTQQ